MLKIWGRANSINVQKVLWCCGELGLEFERIDAGNNFGVTGTAAYLAHRAGKGLLFPADTKTRFDAERWMDWQATVFWPALRPLFIQLIRTRPSRRDPAVISRSEELSLAAVRILDAWLAGRRFLAGDAFSMADIPAGVAVHRWYELDTVHPEVRHVRGWYDLMKGRQPFRDVVMTPLS
jgi:glutathione S-transferase